MKLLIIGNGFDIAHGMATKYSDFKDYLTMHKPSLKESLEELYPDKNEKGKYLLWSDFEEMLAYPDLQYANSVNDLLGTDLMGEYWANHVISEWFKEWAKHINYESYSVLPENHPFRKYLSKDNVALSFNHTSTLQGIYDFNDVLNIHGNSARGLLNSDEEIIFGHRHIEGNSHPLVTATEKPVEKVLEAHRQWFSDLERNASQINEIVIMGLSYGEVDLPYLEKVKRCCPKSPWTLFWYADADREKAVKCAERLKLPCPSFPCSKPNLHERK